MQICLSRAQGKLSEVIKSLPGPEDFPFQIPSSQSLQEEGVTKHRLRVLPSSSRDSHPEGRGGKGGGYTLHNVPSRAPRKEL